MKCIVFATLVADCRITFIWLAALVTFFCGILLAALLEHWYSQSPMTASTELEKPSLHHGTDKFVPNNLPHVRGPFVGRDSELQEISAMLLASSAYVAMVSIFGAPAVGKSTLAIQVGHELAGKGISVRYVDLNEAHHLFARHVDASDKPTSIHSTDDTTDLTLHQADSEVTIPWYSYTKKKYVLTSPKKLIMWAKELTNDTLLILDNCDDFLQRNKTHENNFKEMLLELLKASKYLRIVSTSRAQMLIVSGFRPYPLKELDPSSAVTLLQSISNLITSDEGKVIAELVGNNPLALGIVADLINTKCSPPHAIIDELRKRLMQTLSPNTLSSSQRILTILKLSYNYLDDRIQVCSLYLSHFPGSFHRAAAQSILNMCNLSDPEYCLKTLIERSLLEEYWHTGQLRYQFHRLIGEFLQYVQTEYNDAQYYIIKFEFNPIYQMYYSQDILSLSQIYSSSPDSNEMIGKLEHDMHNFLNILQKMVKRQLDMKSAANIAYSFTYSSDFVTELLNCDECFIELLQALNIFFDPEILVSNETSVYVLYFSLISNAKEWFIISKFSTESCITACVETFARQYYWTSVKWSAADRYAPNAYFYTNPITCSWDCPAYFLMQQVVILLFCFSIMIRHGGKHLYIITILMGIGIGQFAHRLHYYHNLFALCIFRMIGYSNPFIELFLVATLFVCQKILGKILTALLHYNTLFLSLCIILFLNIYFLWFKVCFSHLALYMFMHNSFWVHSYSGWYTYNLCTYGFMLCCNIMYLYNNIFTHNALVCFLFNFLFFIFSFYVHFHLSLYTVNVIILFLITRHCTSTLFA